MEVETVITLTQIARTIAPHQIAEIITIKVQITATIRDQTEIITPKIITVGTTIREIVIAEITIGGIIMVSVITIETEVTKEAVSYTHLDVYKRQKLYYKVEIQYSVTILIYLTNLNT